MPNFILRMFTFPEFGLEHLKEAVIDFSSRKRTFGGDVDANKKKIKVEESLENKSDVMPHIATV